MTWRFNRSGGTGLTRALAAATLLGIVPAQAQYPTACPPPRKLAAGACVIACPAGYEDQGRVCVYRNMSR